MANKAVVDKRLLAPNRHDPIYYNHQPCFEVALPVAAATPRTFAKNLMSYSVHILRQTPEGQGTPITQDEWNAFIDSDPDLQRPEPGHINYSETTALLPMDGVSPDDWQCLSWVTGSILSDYPQQPMLKKMGQIARHFSAVVMSDDGDIWTLDEEGRVSMEGY